MDVDEDSDLFSKTPAPLVKTAWVSICTKKYHVINQSKRRITNACRCVLGFIAFKVPLGVVLKNRMHISTYWKGPRREKI